MVSSMRVHSIATSTPLGTLSLCKLHCGTSVQVISIAGTLNRCASPPDAEGYLTSLDKMQEAVSSRSPEVHRSLETEHCRLLFLCLNLERLILHQLRSEVEHALKPLQFMYQEDLGVDDAVLYTFFPLSLG